MPQMKICGIKNAAIAQMVEHVIGNDEVSSSNLLSSSKIPITKVVGIFLCPPCLERGYIIKRRTIIEAGASAHPININ